MSYKTLLKTKGITPDKVEKYHEQRKIQIAKATRDYYQSLSYKQADKIREKMETKAKKKVAQKLKLEEFLTLTCIIQRLKGSLQLTNQKLNKNLCLNYRRYTKRLLSEKEI